MSLFFVGHPKETDLALFAGGELGPLARWRIERHLQSCEACQTDVADFFHLQGNLEELINLPSSVNWDDMALRIREAVAQAGETNPEPAWGFFHKPLVWQLGLAAATVICGFIVVQQYPFQVGEKQVMTASSEQDAVRSAVQPLEGGQIGEDGASLAPAASLSGARSADQERKGQAVEDVDALTPVPAGERARETVPENKPSEWAARTAEALPGDRTPDAPPRVAEPKAEPNRLVPNLRANEDTTIGAGRDALDQARGRVVNAPSPVAPPRQVEARRKDDATMTIALADKVTPPAAVEEEFEQPLGGKTESSSDEMRLEKTAPTRARPRPVLVEGQSGQMGASFAAQTTSMGTSIRPAAGGSEVVVDIKTDGGVRFRTVDAATGRITITDVYAQ